MAPKSTVQASSVTAPANEQKRKSVFVVSPIGSPGTEVHRNAYYALKYIFRVALKEEEGWDVHRADEGKSPDSIGQHVIKALHDADLVIADLTGHNPNVFYELAIAHGWRKPVVHLIAKGESVPFDIVDQRTIFYDITDLDSVEKTVVTLRDYANHALEHAEDLVTPLTNFAAFNQIRSESTDGGEAVVQVLEQVLSRLSRLESSVRGGGRPPYDTGFDIVSDSEILSIEERYAAMYAELLRARQGLLREEPDEDVAEQIRQVEKQIDTLIRRVPPTRREKVVKRARYLVSDDAH